MIKKQRKIGVLALALLITGSIDSIRNMPTIAMFGPKLVFFAIIGAVFFLLPVGLVAAELVTTQGLRSGVYAWVKEALGEKTAFFAIWLQWINTMVWYPTVLSFIAGTIAYLINPGLAQQPWYLVGVIVLVFWGLTLLSLRGIQFAVQVASACAVIGMVVPILIILVLGIVWALKGLPMHIHFSEAQMLPNFADSQSWLSLEAITTSFLGMELAAVHAKEIKETSRVFPLSLLMAVFFIFATMMLGSLVIAWVLPQKDIHLVDGTMQVFSRFSHAYHITWLLPVCAVMLVIGSVGGMINWVISPAKGLLHAAEDAFLPRFFTQQNKHGVADNLMLVQAVVVTVICLAFVLMPTVNSSYWLLSDLSTELYVLMYVIMFIAAIVYKFRNPDALAGFKIWGGKFGMLLVCSCGMLGCLLTLVIGFMRPEAIVAGEKLNYFATFAIALAIMLLPIVGFYYYRIVAGGSVSQKDFTDNSEQ